MLLLLLIGAGTIISLSIIPFVVNAVKKKKDDDDLEHYPNPNDIDINYLQDLQDLHDLYDIPENEVAPSPK